MLINYIKTAYRNMVRNFSQTLINVLGLAIGMTSALLIFLWVQNQLSYDQWQKNKDNIYRLEYSTWVIMPPYLGDAVTELPEVKKMARLYAWYEPTITYNENAYNINNFIYADSTLFDIFNFDFIHGQAENALNNPFSVVLTESISRKLFGNENPIGKELLMDNQIPYTVSGVIRDVKRLHFDVNAIAAVQDVAKMYGNNRFLEARNHNFLIYLLLDKNANKDEMQEKINQFVFDKFQDEDIFDDPLLLRPFNDIYFERNLPHESFVKHGNFNLVIIFSAISVLILLIACINFINITTAKANLREKEIAVRKIVGAGKSKIAYQFLGETFFMVLVAHILSIVFLELALPKFNFITNEFIEFNYLSPVFLITVIGIILLTTFLSGIYPSLYLSSLKPVMMLKGKSGQKSKGNLRKTLMIAQFVISIFLIISTIIILKQLNFVLNKDLGWNKENIVMFKLRGSSFEDNVDETIKNKEAFKNELLKNPNIINTTFISQHPGNLKNTWTWTYNGEDYPTKIFNGDPEFINTLGLQIIQGRNFDRDKPTDYSDVKMIINETAAKQMSLDKPVGTFLPESGNIEIIGVVKDFNFNSLHNKIEPMAIRWLPQSRDACVRISGNNIPETIKYIESLYNEFCPKYPFEYTFLDEEFAKQYENEMKQSKILVFFAFIAIFIAGLGLFGMSAFISSTRIKEIGIRKALGSSTSEIILLFSGSFIRWILIAFVIASPIAYYLVKQWLLQYPYQTNISWWVFVAALMISIIIALITIGYQIIKSSRTNPADCLRYE